MDSLGIKSAYLVGNLVGANIAVHIATSNLGRVKGLMLGQLCYHAVPMSPYIMNILQSGGIKPMIKAQQEAKINAVL